MSSTLPTHHRALVVESTSTPLIVEHRPVPAATLGSAVIHVEAAGIISYQREIYNGTRAYSFPTPLVAGMSAIGRIAALGTDATSLQHGQLVFADCMMRGRDNPDNAFLLSIHDGGSLGSKKLARDVWRDGTFAEYAMFPLENCIPLDEARLCRELGYEIKDLMYMDYLLVAFGGLRDIKLEPGETIVVSPATGGYGGAAVMVAIAMGARVIAMGRNETELARMKKHVLDGSPNASIETVKMTGDESADAASLKAFGTIDAVIDFTPPQASKSSHLRSAVHAIRKKGRISLMGLNENPMVPWTGISKDLMFKGKLMYEREDMVQFVKMLERGLFPRGKHFVDTRDFRLEDWAAGLDAAAEHTGISKHVVFVPKSNARTEPIR
ncbi:hypothetical protein N0V90_011449 [Kalmusia sp. IMI 367209]|nr:hypothetical protein N0V90_011449 [Kalmusia sp. IMI 367209]